MKIHIYSNVLKLTDSGGIWSQSSESQVLDPASAAMTGCVMFFHKNYLYQFYLLIADAPALSFPRNLCLQKAIAAFQILTFLLSTGLSAIFNSIWYYINTRLKISRFE